MPCGTSRLFKGAATHPCPPWRGYTMFCEVSFELSRGVFVQLTCQSCSRCYGTCFGPGRDGPPPQYDKVMLWAACTLGFFAFLRAGEFTFVPGQGQALLTPEDIRVDSHCRPTFLAVTLRGSKIGPVRHWLHAIRWTHPDTDLPSGCCPGLPHHQTTCAWSIVHLRRRLATDTPRLGVCSAVGIVNLGC